MRTGRLSGLFAALCIAALPAFAANPYKSRQHIARLPADVGMEASRLRDTRHGNCGIFDPANPTTKRGLNEADFHDCLVVETDEGFGFFTYDVKAKKWKAERVIQPGDGAGARLVESGTIMAQRQLQFVLPNETLLVVTYSGDSKWPLEAIKHVGQLGFKPIQGVSFVAKRVEDPPTTITFRR